MRKNRKKRFSIPGPNKEEKIKKTFKEIEKRERADRVIKNFQKQFPRKSLIQLLPLLFRRCLDINVVKAAIKRVERRQTKKLNFDDLVYLDQLKTQISQVEEEKKKHPKSDPMR